MEKNWDNHYWFVIGSIVDQTTSKNNDTSWTTLLHLGKYIPCVECRTHFENYLHRERVIDKEWLNKLKYDIKLNSYKKVKGCKGCK